MHDDFARLCRLRASDVDFEKGVQLLMESSRVLSNGVDGVDALRIRWSTTFRCCSVVVISRRLRSTGVLARR
jgi:hypothetical protein